MDDTIYDLAVIGGGGAGQMGLLRSVLNHLKTVVFLGDPKTTKRSRAAWVSEVDNIPGFFDKKRPITATAREVVQFIDSRSDLKPFLHVVKKAALKIKKEKDLFQISTDSETIPARYVLLCSGTMDVQPLIGGSIQPILPFANRGDVLYCMRCDGHKAFGNRTAVIGHKASAGHIAVTLKERYGLESLFVLTHGKEFEGSKEVQALIKKYNIQIISGEINAVLGDAKQGLTGFQIGDQKVEVTKAFVALGSIVYNDLAKQLGVKLSEREHVITDDYGETSVTGFYAAGDLVEGRKKQVYTAWDMAVDAVDAIDEEVRLLKRDGKY